MSEFVVVPDLHGEVDKLEYVVDRYNSEDVKFVQLGDFIDRGPDSKATIELLKEVGAITLLGNHELVLLGALDEADSAKKLVWQQAWKPDSGVFRYENKMLESYGVDSAMPAAEAADSLREVLESLGHMGFLGDCQLYFETERFIAVHAGLKKEPWEMQREYLNRVSTTMRLENDYSDEPVQVFDRKWELATQDSAESATAKIVLSGHAHNLKNPNDIKNPNRVRLASRLDKGMPLFVWQSWDGRVKEF